MKPLDPITLVMVLYNSAHILPETLPRLAPLKHLILVDNGSTDDSAALAQRLLPQARVLRLARNVGFGRANNAALARVETEFAMLLNPDCLVEPDALAALLDAAERYPGAAILAPKLFDAPGKLGLCYRPAFYEPQPRDLLEPQGDLCSPFLTGAAMLLRMAPMRAVGFFDPWFFLYYEDDDLCLRARRAGHELVLVSEATVMHRVRQSSAPSARSAYRRDYCLTLSKFYIQRKYFGAGRAWTTWLRVLLGSLLALPLHLLLYNRRRLIREFARLRAALAAPRELAQRHCLVNEDWELGADAAPHTRAAG